MDIPIHAFMDILNAIRSKSMTDILPKTSTLTISSIKVLLKMMSIINVKLTTWSINHSKAITLLYLLMVRPALEKLLPCTEMIHKATLVSFRKYSLECFSKYQKIKTALFQSTYLFSKYTMSVYLICWTL